VLWPVIRRLAVPQRVLQLAVCSLHYPVAARVESCGGDVLDAQPRAQGLPHRRCKLGAAVGGDGGWYSISAYSPGDQRVCRRGGLHILDWNRL